MNIAILEDDYNDRLSITNSVERYLEERCYHARVSAFESGETLLEAFSPGAFAVLLLDIYLPGMDGLRLAKEIRKIDPDCKLIMVTVSTDHALESYGVHAIAYVVKPVDEARLFNALALCRHEFERNARAISVPVAGDVVLLPLPNIRYAEVYGKNTRFHLLNGVLEARLPLDEVERRLKDGPFLRCHRCYIVNMNHVEDIIGQDLLLKDGGRVPLRRRAHKETRLRLARFLSGHVNEGVGIDE